MSAKIDLVVTGIVVGSVALGACSDDGEPPPAEVSDLTEAPVEVPRVGILDRQGRPEISNFLIISDRTAYNAEDTFALSTEGRSFFTSKLQTGLEMWDAMDGFNDWTPGGGEHPLVRILIDDMLIVDMSKPCAYDTPTFLDIEISAVRGVEHQTCGGRFPNEDAVDVLQTWYVNDFLAGTVADGVDAPAKWATATFPYLATKNGFFEFWGGFF